MHHAPRKDPRVELRRRQRPGPGTHQHQRLHARDVRQGETEAGRAAPVVADQRGAMQIETTQQRGQVGDVAVEAVRVLARWLFRQAETDHVRDDDAVSRRRKWRHKVAVQEAPGGVAVQQHDWIAAAFVHVMHAPAVDAGKARPERPLAADDVGQVDTGHITTTPLPVGCKRSHRMLNPSLAEQDSAMSTMQAEVFEAFRSIDIPEDKALKAATALGQRDSDGASLKTDMSVMKWMMGFVLAFQIAIFVKLFIH